MSLISDKQAIRQKMRDFLGRVSGQERLSAGKKIAENLANFASSLNKHPLKIALFNGRSDEIATKPLKDILQQLGAELFLPKNTGYPPFFHPLNHAGLDTVGALDIIITPGLAFDPVGHRLGRGSGYYDRALATLNKPTLFIGVGFDEQIITKVPYEAHDVTMDYLCTPMGLITIRTST